MSVNYATGLSDYDHKGKCGMPETHDPLDMLRDKVAQLITWVKECRHLVVITGAGISTASGIPDFRGPKGVWTLEEKGETPQCNVTFDTAQPTYTHMALVALEREGILKHVISQNVDGLHLRSGLPRDRLSELHGNMFVEDCEHCYTQYIRTGVLPTMALRPTGHSCTQTKRRGNRCRGKLHDTILDWEDALPEADAVVAEENCKSADLCLCLGTSLQIIPCGNYPLLTKRNGGRIVIVNLQTTKQDKKCDLKIHGYVDKVMAQLCRGLDIRVPQWIKPHVVLHSVHPSPYTDRYPKIEMDPELKQDGIDWGKDMKTEASHSDMVGSDTEGGKEAMADTKLNVKFIVKAEQEAVKKQSESKCANAQGGLSSNSAHKTEPDLGSGDLHCEQKCQTSGKSEDVQASDQARSGINGNRTVAMDTICKDNSAIPSKDLRDESNQNSVHCGITASSKIGVPVTNSKFRETSKETVLLGKVELKLKDVTSPEYQDGMVEELKREAPVLNVDMNGEPFNKRAKQEQNVSSS